MSEFIKRAALGLRNANRVALALSAFTDEATEALAKGALLSALALDDAYLARGLGEAIDREVAFQAGGPTHLDIPQVNGVALAAIKYLRSLASPPAPGDAAEQEGG